MKRIVIRKGDVFCAEIENEYKCYFQYIERDRTQLGSNVIRVFKKHYPIVYEPIINEIIKDEVSFYAHTILKFGVHDNVWHKVGTSKEVGDTRNVKFRMLGLGWYFWTINESIQKVGVLNETIRGYDFGWVFTYKEIIKKIKTGHYSDWLEFKERK
ncbi:MAG: hypothetical protein J5797_02500 [Prevotella sp.]|nr:hypothetical protein [Prevotella sp.]